MADKPRVPGEDASGKPADELSQAPKSSHNALFAKMDALVGRQRADASNDADEIPVLKNIVAMGVTSTSDEPHASLLGPNNSKELSAQLPSAASAQNLSALLEPHLITALTQQFTDQLQPQLQALIANAVRDALARESELIAKRIAAQVGQILNELLRGVADQAKR